jgi:NTE family protein
VPQTGGLRRRHLWATLLLTGCALQPDADHSGPDAPSSAPLPRVPRTAWVFSSGGPRGFVHVGVLKALDELGLVPDLIVGASAGAAVACLRAAGRSAREIETLALNLMPWGLARMAVGASERLSGSGLAELMREEARHHLLQDLPIPMVCVAQRLDDRSVVAFNRGDLGLAVQASAAIEGQFAPVRIHGQRHADADLVMPLPVRVARALGATRVLAVDASAHEDRAPAGTERWRAGDLRKRALTQPDADLADVLLHPEFGYYTGLSREYRERAIAAGHRETLAAAAALRALHAPHAS